MLKRTRIAAVLAPIFAVGTTLFATPARADQTLTLDGDVPESGPDHFFVPFQVPAGTAEIEILHDDLSADNILDFGLNDPSGYRGWGGGTSENTIVGVNAASRAYVPGPIAAGEWKVVVGKAKVKTTPAKYHIVVTLRTAATLPPQTNRKKYAAIPAISAEKKFYAVDFHVHSKESTDARPDLEELATFAESQGMNAIEISDHNTVTQLDFYAEVQAKHPKLLLIPGIEFTTYAGHGNAIGATEWVEHKIGQPGVTIESSVTAILKQGALFAINHPAIDAADLCIGCAWKHNLDASLVSAVEIETGGFKEEGFAFLSDTMKFWEQMLTSGQHLTPISGSDDHKAGIDEQLFQSQIGHPVTMVLANELSVSGIIDGIKRGKTVVKTQDSSDPMIVLTSDPPSDTDTVKVAKGTKIKLHAEVTGLKPNTKLRFVKNGTAMDPITVDADPFMTDLTLDAPTTGEDRIRMEIVVGEVLATVTSHVYVATAADPVVTPPITPTQPAASSDGGCAATPQRASAWGFAMALLAGLVFASRRRTRA